MTGNTTGSTPEVLLSLMTSSLKIPILHGRLESKRKMGNQRLRKLIVGMEITHTLARIKLSRSKLNLQFAEL